MLHMLRGAYSHLNNFSKVILLITLVFGFLLFSSLLGILVLVPFFGSEVISMLSAPDYKNVSVVNAMKVIQILNMAGGLLLPAILYVWLCLPDNRVFGGFKKPIRYLPIVVSAFLILLSQPLIGLANEINSYLSLPEALSFVENWMKNAENQGEMITEAFLSGTSASDLIINIFMIAVLPAQGSISRFV
jgi:hypothetical protein